jgi:hypothetical protein
LQRVVVVGEGAVVGVANADEPGPTKADVRNSPGDRISGILARYANLGDDVVAKSREGPERVKEAGVAETRVVNEVWGNRPGVGSGVLLVVRHYLRAGAIDALRGLVLVAPVVAPHPLRLRRLDEVQADDKSISVERRRVVLHIVVGKSGKSGGVVVLQ